MALWHASRPALCKCFFNFKKVRNTCILILRSSKKLVRLSMAFAFANSNGKETGWDPTVIAITVDNRRQYIFDGEGTRYVTDFLFGRGTRVFLITKDSRGGN